MKANESKGAGAGAGTGLLRPAKEPKPIKQPKSLPPQKGEGPASSPSEASPLSSYQRFEIRRVNRTDLKMADYNPRTIDEKAKRRLKTLLVKGGLVEPIVWNSRTGNIVGGHQRIEQLDKLHGDQNYALDVALVDLPLHQEMETNIALNNAEAQGVFDINLLSKMFKDQTLDIEATGFDMADMMQMFGENPLDLKENNLSEMADKLAQLRDKHSDVKETLADAQDPNFFTVLVFKNHIHRQRFSAAIGTEDNRYVDGKAVAALLNIDLDKPMKNEGRYNERNEDDSDNDEEDE